jgi:hypothetical protein
MKAVTVLGNESSEEELVRNIKDILAHFPEYPTAQSEKYGTVFVSVPQEHDKIVYNVPISLITVFPGEDHGLHSKKDTLELLKNTFYNQQNEGGNDLVFINLQAARIGLLDLERFKRQVKYSLLPNGTATDMAMQTLGRYNDMTNFDFMANLGIWFENFGLPVVINECLMQSYNGTIRLFPNWPKDKDASFNQLRGVGAFLISATQKSGKVTSVKIFSEKGADLKIISPWPSGGYILNKRGKKKINGSLIELRTLPGELIVLQP